MSKNVQLLDLRKNVLLCATRYSALNVERLSALVKKKLKCFKKRLKVNRVCAAFQPN